MPKINEIPRTPKTCYLDKGLPELLEKLCAKRTVERVRPKTYLADLYNEGLRKFLKEEGLIKKGDPLWID